MYTSGLQHEPTESFAAETEHSSVPSMIIDLAREEPVVVLMSAPVESEAVLLAAMTQAELRRLPLVLMMMLHLE